MIKIDTLHGKIESDGIIIAPLNISETRTVFIKAGLPVSEEDYKNEWKKIMTDIFICNEKFGMNIEFNNDKLHSIWLSWRGGIAEIKGYNSSEDDLIQDKNTLSNLMIKCILKKNPETKDYNKDIFNFDWGYISISASIRSTLVGIGIAWENIKVDSNQ